MWFRYFPNHKGWSFQVARAVAGIGAGGADFHEMNRALSRMEVGNAESWCNEWTRLADHVAALAAAADASRVTARDAHVRASNYCRWAMFYLPHEDPRRIALAKRSEAYFVASAKLMDNPPEFIEVPYAGTVLSGFILHPPRREGDSGRPPVVIRIGGADSTKEELFVNGSRSLADRGAAVVCVDYPGQGNALLLRHLYAEPAFEKPVQAVIDVLDRRGDLDTGRMGIMCASFGGYYGPRVAAMEPRIKALAVWGANFDCLEDIYEYFPPIQGTIRWLLGTDTDAAARERLQAFSLAGVAERITCPTLIYHGADDFIVRPGCAQRLYDTIAGPKELKMWTEEEGGSVHCMWDNAAQAMPQMMDWLVKQLA